MLPVIHGSYFVMKYMATLVTYIMAIDTIVIRTMPETIFAYEFCMYHITYSF